MDSCFIRKWAVSGSRVGEKHDRPVTPRAPFRLDAPRASFVCIDALVFSHPQLRCCGGRLAGGAGSVNAPRRSRLHAARAHRPVIDRSPGLLVPRPSSKVTVAAPGEQATLWPGRPPAGRRNPYRVFPNAVDRPCRFGRKASRRKFAANRWASSRQALPGQPGGPTPTAAAAESTLKDSRCDFRCSSILPVSFPSVPAGTGAAPACGRNRPAAELPQPAPA